MIAALLLNLEFYQRKRDADAAPLRNRDRRRDLEDAAEALAELLEVTDTPPVAQPLRKSLRRLKTYSQADDTVTTSELSSLLADLSAREFEMRQELLKSNQQQAQQYLLILEQISVFLTYLQDDEEAVLVLLMG